MKLRKEKKLEKPSLYSSTPVVPFSVHPQTTFWEQRRAFSAVPSSESLVCDTRIDTRLPVFERRGRVRLDTDATRVPPWTTLVGETFVCSSPTSGMDLSPFVCVLKHVLCPREFWLSWWHLPSFQGIHGRCDEGSPPSSSPFILPHTFTAIFFHAFPNPPIYKAPAGVQSTTNTEVFSCDSFPIRIAQLPHLHFPKHTIAQAIREPSGISSSPDFEVHTRNQLRRA